MCNCIKKIEEKLTEDCEKRKYRKPFEKVVLDKAFVQIGDGSVMGLRTYSRAFVTLTGRRKRIEMNVIHSHCPFCGEEITKDEN